VVPATSLIRVVPAEQELGRFEEVWGRAGAFLEAADLPVGRSAGAWRTDDVVAWSRRRRRFVSSRPSRSSAASRSDEEVRKEIRGTARGSAPGEHPDG
jgi:hypothetical protein